MQTSRVKREGAVVLSSLISGFYKFYVSGLIARAVYVNGSTIMDYRAFFFSSRLLR